MAVSSSARERLPVATAIWHCDPNAIICPNDHLWAHYKGGYSADIRRVSGHTFLRCRECGVCFFALFAELPTPMVTCYLISDEHHDHWANSKHKTPATPELLYQLHDPDGRSYNPYYLPPSAARR